MRQPVQGGPSRHARMPAGWIALLTLLLAAAPLGAQTLTVAYVEGEAQLQTASGTKAISIGDRLPNDGSLKIAERSYLELTGMGLTITCTQPGSYSIATLLATATSRRSTGAVQAVASLLSKLASGGSKVQSAALGARGADESASAQSDWVTSYASAYLESGKALIGVGKYAEAIEELLRAIDAASDEELPEVRATLASAYSLSGDTRNAYKQMSQVTLSGGEPWAADFVLLKGKLLVDTFAFGQSVSWLTSQGRDLSQDAQRAPLYYFLLALGYQGLGDAARERDSLNWVVKVGTDSDVGRVAAKMLSEL